MSGGIRLSGWPTAPKCMSWSDDGLLAVALGECVEILIPKLQLSQPWRHEAEERRWHRARLSVSLFTEEESPCVSPLPFRTFSLGEEQSFSHVIGLAWSSGGLAKHGRCALAVLTSNLVLSIWAADADPKYGKSWKRVAVINHVLEAVHKGGGVVQDSETARLQRRIRSFSWGPSLPDSRSKDHEFARDAVKPFDHHFLAVSNDVGQIILIAVESPFRYMHSERKPWAAKVLAYQDMSGTPLDPAQLKDPDDPIIHAENYVSDLSWSPYIELEQGDRKKSICVLAYIMASRLNLLLCEVSTLGNRFSVSLLQEKKDFTGEYNGPLDWTTGVCKTSPKPLHLLVFTREELHCITLESSSAQLDDLHASVTSQPNDNCWDEVAGHAFTRDLSHERNALHLLTQSSVVDDIPGDAFAWPLQDSKIPRLAEWAEIVQHQQSLFDEEFDLKGRVSARMYGMAASPAGDEVAVAFSLHPSQMIQYITNSQQETLICFSSCLNEEDDKFKLVDRIKDPTNSVGGPKTTSMLDYARISSLSTEAHVLSLKAQSAQAHSEEGISPYLRLFEDDGGNSLFPDNSNIETAAGSPSMMTVMGLRDYLSARQDLIRRVSRFTVLAETDITNVSNFEDQISNVVLRRLRTVLPSLFTKAPQSPEVRSILLLYSNLERESAVSANSEEACIICGYDVHFENTYWARCLNDHRFARCALTLLAIQAPGISRFCGICCRQYLSEQSLLALDSQPSSTNAFNGVNSNHNENSESQATETGHKEPSMSVFEALVAAFDRCLYCGGKFID